MSADISKHDRFSWNFLRFAVAALVLSAAVALWASVSPQLLAAERGPLLPSEDAVAPASFAGIIEAVEPGVVNVSVRGHRMSDVRAMQPELPFEGLPPGSPFEDFLRRFFGDRAVPSDPEGVPFRGMGTGFIVDPEGLVVTNYHVVDAADEIIVRLHDGSEYEATLRGHDPKTDLALLDIVGDDFPYLLFGDSDAARVGDWVVAVGNPFGLGGSATAGIISARGRDIQSGPYDDFLQIDAPINQGNSGGPLFDLSGRVIGVNTAIFSPNGGNVGIGFAIPASLAEKIIDELRENGRIERGWLGVSVQGLDADIAAGLGLAGPEGALVASVVPGGPAERAGLQAGDVIVAIDGEPVADVRDLVARVGDADPDSSVELEVWRQGERETVEATLGVGPDAEIPVTAPRATSQPEARLGMTVADVNETARRRFPIEQDVDGALIVAVDPSGAAARKGLRPGDVITMVGNQPIDDAAELRAALDEATAEGREVIVVQIARGEARLFVGLEARGR